RAIARQAGVDPALVHHFFNSKSQLFTAAMQLPVDPEPFIAALLTGERETLGARLVLALVELWDRPDGILGRLPTAAAPDAPQTRAALAGSQIVGLAMARKIVCIDPIATADPAWLAATIGPTIQHYLTAPLPPTQTRAA